MAVVEPESRLIGLEQPDCLISRDNDTTAICSKRLYNQHMISSKALLKDPIVCLALVYVGS